MKWLHDFLHRKEVIMLRAHVIVVNIGRLNHHAAQELQKELQDWLTANPTVQVKHLAQSENSGESTLTLTILYEPAQENV